jgi:hypothetical protein
MRCLRVSAGLAIELSGQQVKFRVHEDAGSAALDFPTTLKLLKSALLPAIFNPTPSCIVGV